MSLNDIVDVQISRQTQAVSQKGFGTALILGIHTAFSNRIKYYGSIEEVEADFASNTEEYKASLRLFGQEYKPEKIAIGRRNQIAKQKVNVVPLVVHDDTDYSVTINGVLFTINSGSGATAETIATALDAEISAGTQPVTVTDNTGDIDIEANVAGVPFTVLVSDNLQLVTIETAHDVLEELSQIVNESDDWYGLILARKATYAEYEADVKVCAEWVEARMKVFGVCSNSSDVVDSVTTDLASYLKDKGFDRTFIIYSSDFENYPEAGWIGLQFPKDPGSSTWKFKAMSGVSVDNLGKNEILNAENKNCNVYITRGGVSMVEEGVVCSGEYIDVIRGIDWLVSRSQERIFGRLVNSEKIPFTDSGVSTIESELRAQLKEAVRKEVLSPDPEPVITVPKVMNINPNDRAKRTLPDLKFDARLAGAIHKIKIRGTVTV